MLVKLRMLLVLLFVASSSSAAEHSLYYQLDKFDIQFLVLPTHSKEMEIQLVTPKGAKEFLFSELEDDGYHIAIIASKAGKYELKLSNIKTSLTPLNEEKISKPTVFDILQQTPIRHVHPLIASYLANPSRKSEHSFWSKVKETGSPLIHKKNDTTDVMTFVYQGEPDTFSVELLGSKRSFVAEENLLHNIPNSTIWYKSFEVSPETVFAYTYSANTAHLQDKKMGPRYYQALKGTASADPLNLHLWRTTSGKFKAESHGMASKAKAHYWSVKKASVPSGKVENVQFSSKVFGNTRTISIYTPPNATLSEHTPIVFVSDGERYSTDALTPNALDNLINENKIPPVVAVFVHNTVPSARGLELPCNESFTHMLAEELLPWLKKRQPQVAKSEDIVVAGSSYGGLAAACANIMRPDVFKYVLSQSGSFWWYPDEASSLSDGQENGWVVRRYQQLGCNGGTRFYFDAGQLETEGSGLDSIGENSEILSDLLREKGCAVANQRFPGGHDLFHWKETIAHGLIALLGHKVEKN